MYNLADYTIYGITAQPPLYRVMKVRWIPHHLTLLLLPERQGSREHPIGYLGSDYQAPDYLWYLACYQAGIYHVTMFLGNKEIIISSHSHSLCACFSLPASSFRFYICGIGVIGMLLLAFLRLEYVNCNIYGSISCDPGNV